MIESWMVSLAMGVTTLIAGYAILRNNVSRSTDSIAKQDIKVEILLKFMDENRPVIKHFSKIEEMHTIDIKRTINDIVELKTQQHLFLTMKEARNEFVSKEIHNKVEDYIDVKIENKVYKLLN